MGGIMRLKGVFFENSSLDQVPPLSVDGFLEKGLICAALPGVSLESMRDLSGNATQWQVNGNPIFTDKAVRINRANGFTSNKLETESYSHMLVFRGVRNMNADAASAIVGGYCLGPSTYNNLSAPPNMEGGSGLFNTCFSPVDANYRTLFYHICTAVDVGTGRLNSFLIGAHPGAKQAMPPATIFTPWSFAMGTVDADAVEMKSKYVVKSVGWDYFSKRNPNTDPTIINGNTFKNRFSLYAGGPYSWRLGTPGPGLDPSSGNMGVIEIAAVGIWNRALSDLEMEQQYKRIASLMLQSRGIEV